ncbi:GMC family oxidoreductase [Aspergillus stella-maris]|uniref:GMC family oxidoreductase n=1 Tax=Aspergillus stella-maris TaxID=1810926 RepID=UPI003CCCBCE3
MLVYADVYSEIENSNLSQIPASGGAFMTGWNNASILLACGKALGGSTARNVMTYQLPTQGSMERWTKHVADDSWNFTNMLPYIMQSQHFLPPRNDLRMRGARPVYDRSNLGRSGPLDVTYPNYASHLVSLLLRGFDEIGLASIDGFTTYLDTLIEKKLNLIIYQSTHAKQILFKNGTIATGVRCDSEVIVSAGAFKTLWLLMVSGIGPANSLERHHIPVVVDLPGVGQNLQLRSFRFNSRPPRGVLTSPGHDVLGWEKIGRNSNTSQFTFTLGDNNDTTPRPIDGDYFSVATAVITALSSGTVDIELDDTFDNPIVDARWLSHPTDLEIAVAGFRRTRELVGTRSLAKVTIEEAYPGSEVQTDDDIVKSMCSSSSTVLHYCCTASMGPRNDPRSVVDTNGRAHGVSRLRVVDISIFPFLTPEYPMSVIYGSAEKIAQGIITGAQ